MVNVKFYCTIKNSSKKHPQLDTQGWSPIMEIGTLPPPEISQRPALYFFIEKEKQLHTTNNSKDNSTSSSNKLHMVVSYIGTANGLLYDELQDVFRLIENSTIDINNNSSNNNYNNNTRGVGSDIIINKSLLNCTHYIYYGFPSAYVIHPLLFLYKQTLLDIFGFPSLSMLEDDGLDGTLLDGKLVDIAPIIDNILNTSFQDQPLLAKLNELLCHVPSEQRISIQKQLANIHLIQNQFFKQSNLIYKYLDIIDQFKQIAMAAAASQQRQQDNTLTNDQQPTIPIVTNYDEPISNPLLDPFGFTHIQDVIRKAILRGMNTNNFYY